MTLRVLSLERPRVSTRDEGLLEAARASLTSQADAITSLASRLDAEFCRALELVVACQGRVVVCGIGKSGLVGRKIAATLACSGTPSFFLHPGEAAHGDLGMVTSEDVVVVVSNSGETAEVVGLMPYFLECGVPIIALVGRPGSSLGRAATVVLDVSVENETCPHNLVPTTSALATLAMGDALAVAAMRMRNFSAEDFGRLHPGGALGRRLKGAVSSVMQREQLPLVAPHRSVREALLTMTSGRCGLVIVVDNAGSPVGIVTDGDLRRALQSRPEMLDLAVSEIMTAAPVTIRDDATVHEAEERMHRLRLKALIAVDSRHRVTGIVEIFSGR